MADKPIIFSAPMVRALIAGRKTQTRRVLKPPYGTLEFLRNGEWRPICTKVFPGDRLWVQENWRACGQMDGIKPSKMSPYEPIRYEADGFLHEPAAMMIKPGRHRWSRHMPRWASRITLTVTDVRVQRLQEISEDDAVAEGVEDVTREVAPGDPDLRFWRRYRDGGWNGYVDTSTGSYASLWTELHGPGAWEANPWVAAYSFTVHRGNIDAIKEPSND